MMEKYIKLIKEYSVNNYKDMTRSAQGVLKHPFIVPGSSSYTNSLWDWDSWLTNVAVRQIMAENNDPDNQLDECEKGCVMNFFENMHEDGRMPIFIKIDGETMPDFSTDNESSFHKPCIAQHAAFIIKMNSNDAEWMRPYISKLKLFLEYYREYCFHADTGLYFWLDDMAIGVDNDPCTFYRPDKSSASILLNCMMYKELKAAAFISELLGIEDTTYEAQAEELKLAVQRELWDERNGFYYSADINLKPINTNEYLHSGMPRHWNCVVQKIDSFAGFFAMWAGIATKEQAERMVKENLLNKNIFGCEYGVRTLSKLEKMYCVVKSGNPSCWLGPVWGISNYIVFKGLVDYGFCQEAKMLAEKTIRLFGKDIEENGQMHEYYDPDTGEGVINPGFQNWNLFVNNMIAYIENKKVIWEF